MNDMRMARIVFTGAAFILIVAQLAHGAQIEWLTLALLAMALLPWAGTFLESFKVGSSGLEAKFREQVEAMIDAETEPVGGQAESGRLLEQAEAKVLTALRDGPHALRAVEPVAREAALTRAEVSRTLDTLSDRELVRSVDTRHGVRWAITPEGRGALGD